jgi:hypothetical protein
MIDDNDESDEYIHGSHLFKINGSKELTADEKKWIFKYPNIKADIQENAVRIRAKDELTLGKAKVDIVQHLNNKLHFMC